MLAAARRLLLLSVSLWLFAGWVVCAQSEYPRAEFSAGFSYVSNFSYGGSGFHLSFAESAASWFQVEAQFDAHFELGRTDFDRYTTVVGPRFLLRRGRITPFAHALIGASHFRAFQSTGTDFAMKFGGGIDYTLTRHWAARFSMSDLVVWNPVKHYLMIDGGLVVRF